MTANKTRLATLAVAAVLAIAAVGLGAAVVQSSDITTDDPSNETIDATVDFSGNTNATVALIDSNGTTVDSQTLDGTSGDTLSASLSPAGANSGETLTFNITATDETLVTLNDTSLTRTVEPVTITDAGNETLTVDVGFNSSTNTTATVVVEDSSGVEAFRDTVTGNDTVTREYNASDGLVADDLRVEVTFDDPTAYQFAYATGPSSGGLFAGGTIAGQDPVVAIGGLVALFGGWKYARREDMI